MVAAPDERFEFRDHARAPGPRLLDLRHLALREALPECCSSARQDSLAYHTHCLNPGPQICLQARLHRTRHTTAATRSKSELSLAGAPPPSFSQLPYTDRLLGVSSRPKILQAASAHAFCSAMGAPAFTARQASQSPPSARMWTMPNCCHACSSCSLGLFRAGIE